MTNMYVNFSGIIQKLRNHRKCIMNLFNKWQEIGSVLDRKLCPKHAFTEQRLEDIRWRMKIVVLASIRM
jgi:hypothetical protein